MDSEDSVALSIPARALGDGWLGLDPAIQLDPNSVLATEVRIRDSSSGRIFSRLGKSISVLGFDDLSGCYVEQAMLQTGVPSVLIIHQSLRNRVLEYLQLAAREGFVEQVLVEDEIDSWWLYTDVEVFERIDFIDDKEVKGLDALKVQRFDHVRLSGGLRLPGTLRKWLTSRPPEVRIVSESPGPISLTILDRDAPGEPLSTREFSESIVILQLEEMGLPAGDYELVVNVSSNSFREVIRLRDADHLSYDRRKSEGIVGHSKADPLFGLNATSQSVDFAGFPIVDISEQWVPINGFNPPWASERIGYSSVRREEDVVRFPNLKRYCIGKPHTEWYETWYKGQTSQLVTCTVCGFQYRLEVSPYNAKPKLRKKVKKKDTSSALNPQRIPKVDRVLPLTSTEGSSWDDAFAAMCAERSGTKAGLELILGQVDGQNPLAQDIFLRNLEALGHAEFLKRPSENGVSWKVNGTSMVGSELGIFNLVGIRSPKIVAAFERAIEGVGGEFLNEKTINAPCSLAAKFQIPEDASECAASMSSDLGQSIELVPNAGFALLQILPKIQVPLSAQGKAPMAVFEGMKKWDPLTCRFVPTESMMNVGSYQITAPRRLYAFVSEDDLSELQFTLGDARTVKYQANLQTNIPMVGYDAEAQELFVPLGADLPGLYGRAVIALSGQLPIPDYEAGALRYRCVAAEAAARIFELVNEMSI